MRVWRVVGLLGWYSLAEEFYEGRTFVLGEEAEGGPHIWSGWVLFARVLLHVKGI